MTKYFKFFIIILIVAVFIFLFDQGRMWVSGAYTAPQSLQEGLLNFSLYLLYSFAFGIANYWVVYQLERRYSWQEVPKKRAVYGVLGAVVISMLTIIVLRIFTVLLVEQKNWSYFITHESYFVYVYSLFITLVVVLVFYVVHFYKALTKQTITAHKTIAEIETAKYESLKSQLDPHFLFNSLNVLTALIEENPEKAERFTTKLSRTYRYVLEQKEKTLVSLQEELDFAKGYMELLKMRFEEALIFEIPTKITNSEYKIPPLSLQLLLENAVKHNAISVEKPLKITIVEADGILTISNNFNNKKSFRKGTGIGLSNIITRYGLVTKRPVNITQTRDTFSVSLPLLTQKTKIMKTYTTNQEEKYNKAVEKVEKIKAFYANLISYLGVNTFLVIVNYNTGWNHKWFIYPLIGWGIGLLFHYFEAFGNYPFLTKDWEEKKIKELMDEEGKEMWQ